MTRYAVLLRAVNVGGRNQVAMADLRKLLESLGHTDVRTYLQSGNAVVAGPDDDPDGLGRRIQNALAGELGVETDVLVRTGPELAAVIDANPYGDRLDRPAYLHLAFLSAQPDPATLAKIDPSAYAPDEFSVGERAIYLWFEHGAGRSKLATGLYGRLGVVATARNWNTVLKLAEMTAH
jgi:uncharacterized protein (DUF1697 family)